MKKGGLKKIGFKRLASLNTCLSYNSINTLMEKVGEGYDSKLFEWREEVEIGVKREVEILESLNKQRLLGTGTKSRKGRQSYIATGCPCIQAIPLQGIMWT